LDGTVRKGKDELGHFVNRPEDVHVYPEVPGLLAAHKLFGWRIVAITNQGGIALGYQTAEDCEAAIAETSRQVNGAFDVVMICRHHPAASNPRLAFCWCRKPRVGSLVTAISLLRAAYPAESFPPELALMVGDREEDRQCAANAGISFLEAEQWRKSAAPLSADELLQTLIGSA